MTDRRSSDRAARGLADAVLPTLILGAAAAIFVLERRTPLRRQKQVEPGRVMRNLALGALSMAVISVAESPVVRPLARRAGEQRRGLVQVLPVPAWARDLLAFLAMDYTIYVWHVLTHKVPALWRLHLVHHVDLDMDSSTALRFHALDMLVSVPWRAAQVALIGTSSRALRAWQAFFFASILFHHSNLRLPSRLERVLARVLTTPRMHGIHHSAVRGETDSNWSSGLSIWDRLHRTFRLDVPQAAIDVGVPGYRDPGEIRFRPSLWMPFVHQRDAWTTQPGIPVRTERSCNRSPASAQDNELSSQQVGHRRLRQVLRQRLWAGKFDGGIGAPLRGTEWLGMRCVECRSAAITGRCGRTARATS